MSHKIRYNQVMEQWLKGDDPMHMFLILLVVIAFVTAIFTAGYNDKPESHKH